MAHCYACDIELKEGEVRHEAAIKKGEKFIMWFTLCKKCNESDDYSVDETCKTSCINCSNIIKNRKPRFKLTIHKNNNIVGWGTLCNHCSGGEDTHVTICKIEGCTTVCNGINTLCNSCLEHKNCSDKEVNELLPNVLRDLVCGYAY